MSIQDSQQQKQTASYFNANASDWQMKSTNGEYSTIRNRMLATLETAKKLPTNSSFMDIGCGTGQLAIELAKSGWESTGVDYAEDMIRIAKENQLKAGVDVDFIHGSFFDEPVSGEYNLISAHGFIEYIPLEALDTFFQQLRSYCRKGGYISIGSRNRIFNLFSFNEFTQLELNAGTVNQIIDEAIGIQMSDSMQSAISKLRTLEYDYNHPDNHPYTNIGVETRYQFTPGDLVKRIEKADFIVSCIYPINFHAFPVQLANISNINPIQKQLALYAQEKLIHDQRLLPFSSSFVIEAKYN